MVSVKNLKIFHVFSFGKIKQENVFEDILGRKKIFLRLYNHKVKKSQRIGIFPKGIVHGFDKKFEIFHLC